MSAAGQEQSIDFPPSGGLWTLLDMINFFAWRIARALAELNVCIQTCSHNEKIVTHFGLQHLPTEELAKLELARDEMISNIATLTSLCKSAVDQIASPHIDEAIDSLSHITAAHFHWSDGKRRFIALRSAITIELKQHFYYQYKREKGLLFFNWKSDWKDVIEAFPNAQADIFSAVDCYALEHDTASVFHSMRVAEFGLRAIAYDRSLQLPKDKLIEWANWQEILKALDEEILKIGKLSAGPDKDRLLAFYSGSRADLNGFKDEYRNVVMHVRITFDEYQAASASVKVREFMKRLVAFGLSTV